MADVFLLMKTAQNVHFSQYIIRYVWHNSEQQIVTFSMSDNKVKYVDLYSALRVIASNVLPLPVSCR